jgi:predicted dehydrogenase
MNRTKVIIIGAGNISNTRHIPALKKLESVEITGALSNRLDRAERTAKTHQIANFAQIDTSKPDGGVADLDWFKQAEAAVIGAPPRQHYELVKMALSQGKHVLIEKPMMMNEAECDELTKLAKKKKLTLYVMHNFQYARRMTKLNDIVASGKYGDIVNITELQFTNHDRRLPEWYNDLPMGLFYDEAAHFMYLLENHAGPLSVDNSHAVYDESNKDAQTPVTLTVNATAGKVPVTMVLNFQSPVCEWYYVVNFKKRILMYDFFKDILIDLPTDNEHRAKDILKNSISQTWQYWTQFIANGFLMITGNLLYGHERVVELFVETLRGEREPVEELSPASGRKNVVAINEVVNRANPRK